MKSFRGLACPYCGGPMRRDVRPSHPHFATRDHIIPKERLATGVEGATVWCCFKCNHDKSHFTVDEWRLAISLRDRRLVIFPFERLALRVLWLSTLTQVANFAASF